MQEVDGRIGRNVMVSYGSMKQSLGKKWLVSLPVQ